MCPSKTHTVIDGENKTIRIHGFILHFFVDYRPPLCSGIVVQDVNETSKHDSCLIIM